MYSSIILYSIHAISIQLTASAGIVFLDGIVALDGIIALNGSVIYVTPVVYAVPSRAYLIKLIFS